MRPDALQKETEWFATRRSVVLGAVGLAGLGAGAAVFEHVWKRKDMTARLFNPFSVAKFDLPPLPGLLDAKGAPMPGFSSADLAGKRSLLVVWASWCPTCRAEHELIVALAKRNLAPIYGADVKDPPTKARLFLAKHGNPFVAVGMDENTYLQRALGAKGVPATFVIGPGPTVEWSTYEGLDEETIEREIVPRLSAKVG
ncbi:redoxin family protein [Methylocystis parvus]|uniref:Redoxin family protein n=1 Tax=Methylocystis parvus TaxID=134 RepID=A0A6B8M475_9HYPH|nr:redoxin family protein [Methylocystis parvus]QGM98704.1 redoxin family protein [Methylocystis parvus]WBK00948.1 redoxin family protein [Methylocystis parvus OBBP]